MSEHIRRPDMTNVALHHILPGSIETDTYASAEDQSAGHPVRRGEILHIEPDQLFEARTRTGSVVLMIHTHRPKEITDHVAAILPNGEETGPFIPARPVEGDIAA